MQMTTLSMDLILELDKPSICPYDLIFQSLDVEKFVVNTHHVDYCVR